MTEALPPNDRATTAAARRRVAAADRARRWREEQRAAELAMRDENVTLREEVATLRAERDRLQSIFERLAATDTVDEDVVRAFVKMAVLRPSKTGALAVGKPQVSVSDVVSVAGYIRCGGRAAGQAAFDAARRRVLERLAEFVPPSQDAQGYCRG